MRAFRFGPYLRRLQKGKSTVYRLGWISDYPVPDVFLASLFASSSPDNHSGFRSRAVDRLLALAHREASDDLRHDLYREAERRILHAAPIAPIGSFLNHWAVQPEVQEAAFDVIGGFDAVNVRLETPG